MPQNITKQYPQGEEKEIEHLRFALAAAGIGTWDLDPIRNVVVWDERCRELYGFAPGEEVPYEQVLKYLHPDDVLTVHQAVQQALNPATTGNYEVRYRTIGAADGRLRWVLSKGKAYFDEQGVASRFAGTAQDITEAISERERSIAAEQEIADARHLADLAIKSAGIGLYRFDLVNDISFYSPAFAEILTGNPGGGKLSHEAFIHYVHPEDRLMRTAAIRSAIETGEFTYAPRVIWDDGSVHRIHIIGACIYNDAGKPLALSGTVKDITAQEQQEHELREAEGRLMQVQRAGDAMFRNVTNSSPTGLWLSDEEGGLTYLNKTLVDWTGMPYEALLGAGWAGAIIEEDRQRSAGVFLNAVAGRLHYDVLFRIKKGDGDVVWCRAAGDPYYREDGSYAGYAGFCMDIDELVKANNEVKAGESRFRSIVEQAPMAIGLLRSRDMVIEVGNPRIFEIWGKNASVTGMRLIDALPEIKGQPFMGLLESVYDTGKVVQGNGVLAKLVRGGTLEDAYFDFVYTPLRDSDNIITGVMVLATEVTEQVLAGRELAQSEAKFRSLVEEAPVATCLFTGREMKIDMANEMMIRVWGKGDTVIGKPLAEALPELEGQPFLGILDNVFTTGITYETKAAPVDLVVNGMLATYYFDFTYKPLKGDSGKVYAIMDMTVDVTDEIMARKKLEESDLFTRSIIDHSPVAKVVLTGENMMIQTVNRNMLELLGRDESITGKPFMEAIPELLDTPVMDRLTAVLVTGETYYQPEEKLQLNRYGRLHTGFYNYIYKALYNTAGEIYGIIITATEVTEQVLARQKVEEAEATLRGAIELAELATWSLDAVTNELTASPRLQQWFGFREGETIYNTGYNPVHSRDREKIQAAIVRAIQPGSGGSYNVEYTVVEYRTGRERIIHALGRILFDEAGNPLKLTGTAQDITEQREARLALEQQVQQRTEELASANEELHTMNEELAVSNEQLVHSNEELAQYAYVASHDLQEPLRKIRLFSGMLDKHQSLTEDIRPLVAKIGHSAERMSLLIRDLLDFSRLLKSDTLMRPVNLNEILAAVTNDFELLMQEKGAVMEADALPVIEAVNLQMNQLFYNLLSNALKFTAPGVQPFIRVSATRITQAEAASYIQKLLPGSEYYHIAFSDNGIGFDTRYSEQIFEVFKRLHGRDMYPGSGIGLALCRRIVANHNGHMYAVSAPDQGTIFHLILPDRQHSDATELPENFSWKTNK